MVRFTKGSTSDARDIAELYLHSFPDSVRFFFPGRDSAELVAATACGFELVLLAGCLPFLARNAKNGLMGYCIVSTSNGIPFYRLLHPKRILRTVMLCLKALGSLRIKDIALLARNWLIAVTSVVEDTTVEKLPGGRIVSIAVHCSARGAGIGKKLLEHAIRHLEEQQIKATYLEVRPDNVPARRLYAGLGFRRYGQNRDLQGPWLRLVRVNDVSN